MDGSLEAVVHSLPALDARAQNDSFALPETLRLPPVANATKGSPCMEFTF